MAVRTRIQPMERTLRIITDGALSPAEQSRAVAAFASGKLREAQQQNERVLGHVPTHRTFVDGAEGKPLESVRPDGRIVFEFEIRSDIATFIAAELKRLSPVLTGAYLRGQKVFADGREVVPGEAMPLAAVLTFLATVPYSRKIEAGRMRMRVPGTSQVYQQAAKAAQRRFGNLASIRFTYAATAGGKAARASRNPAIVVTMR